MLHPSTKKLIDKLFEMTSSAKISWVEGDDGTWLYDTEGYRVTIGHSPSRLVLLDAGGRVLETAGEALLAGTLDEAGNTYAVKMELMVSEARRQFTGSVSIIDQIVSALDLDCDGIPDAEEDIDEVEEFSAPAPDAPLYPDHVEMSSRVAMLAEKVNNPLPDFTTERVDDASEPEAIMTPDAAEPVETAEADATGLATKSGMAEVELASEEGWSVPEDAAVLAVETVEDFHEISSEAGEGPVTQFTPKELDDVTEEPAAGVDDAEPATAMSLTAFGAIGTFGAADGLPEVDDQPAETDASDEVAGVEAPPVLEAVVHDAQGWGDAAEAVDALSMMPSDEPISEEAEYLTVEVEEPIAEASVPEITEKVAEPVQRREAFRLAGKPYVTGVGRILTGRAYSSRIEPEAPEEVIAAEIVVEADEPEPAISVEETVDVAEFEPLFEADNGLEELAEETSDTRIAETEPEVVEVTSVEPVSDPVDAAAEEAEALTDEVETPAHFEEPVAASPEMAVDEVMNEAPEVAEELAPEVLTEAIEEYAEPVSLNEAESADASAIVESLPELTEPVDEFVEVIADAEVKAEVPEISATDEPVESLGAAEEVEAEPEDNSPRKTIYKYNPWM